MRAAGLPVTRRGSSASSSRRTDPEADVLAARIVTEALTNALRHAGATPTRVTVHHGEDAVDVEGVATRC